VADFHYSNAFSLTQPGSAADRTAISRPVPPDRDCEPVREFRTFFAGLHELADWLAQCRVKTVAMESTGVYWIPLFEILEQRGFEVLLVNPRNVPSVHFSI
jgi:transposase